VRLKWIEVESVGSPGSVGRRLGEKKKDSKEPVVRGGRAPKHQDFEEGAAMGPARATWGHLGR
jgi:hypothetical protein